MKFVCKDCGIVFETQERLDRHYRSLVSRG